MIWVIGGTQDSYEFIERLEKENKLNKIIITTATEYGGKLLEKYHIKTLSKPLNKDMMIDFVQKNNIEKIVDISHPYAKDVSINAIEVSNECNIEYYRYERQKLEIKDEKIIDFDSVEKIIEYLEEKKGNILVTLGSNNIPKFAKIKGLERYYFRILSKWDMVKKCEDNGILPKNIIAMQGPFSKELNKAMIKQLNVKYMVTKKSGASGGEKEKIEAGLECDIEILCLNRPEILYPNKYETVEKLLKKLNI